MPHIQDLFEEKARAGDGQYAIAFAILELANHQKATARALDAMGMNNQVAEGAPGAFEMIGMQMQSIASSLAQIAARDEE